MAKDAVLQVRIDAQLKNDVEQLYREMGTTFSEAVRLFARQSLIRRRLPFDVSETDQSTRKAGLRRSSSTEAPGGPESNRRSTDSGFALFAAYASDRLRERESAAWQEAASAKHLNPPYVANFTLHSSEKAGEI